MTDRRRFVGKLLCGIGVIVLIIGGALLAYGLHLMARSRAIERINDIEHAGVSLGPIPADTFSHFLTRYVGEETKAVSFCEGFVDSDLKNLDTMRQLESLSISSSNITGACLSYLRCPETVTSIAMNCRPVDDVVALELRRFTNLQYLGLCDTRVGDETVSAIARLAKLEELYLASPNVTDAGVALLEHHPSLVRIMLGSGRVTDRGIQSLGTISTLQEICIFHGTPVADRGLQSLSRLSDLRMLSIGSRDITDAGVAHFRDHPSLQEWYLGETGVTDACTADLATLSQLKLLQLDECRITDDGLKHLGSLGSLENLDLNGTDVSDAGLVHLYGLTNLQYISLRDTQVTPDGVAKLQEALPDCKIFESSMSIFDYFSDW